MGRHRRAIRREMNPASGRFGAYYENRPLCRRIRTVGRITAWAAARRRRCAAVQSVTQFGHLLGSERNALLGKPADAFAPRLLPQFQATPLPRRMAPYEDQAFGLGRSVDNGPDRFLAGGFRANIHDALATGGGAKGSGGAGRTDVSETQYQLNLSYSSLPRSGVNRLSPRSGDLTSDQGGVTSLYFTFSVNRLTPPSPAIRGGNDALFTRMGAAVAYWTCQWSRLPRYHISQPIDGTTLALARPHPTYDH